MLKKFLFIMLLGLPLAAFPSKSGLLPGLYEAATSTNGGPPEKSRHCVPPEEADQGLQAPQEAEGCRLARSTLGGGRVEMLQTCKDSSMSLSGSYTATSYVLDGKLQAKAGNQTVNISTHTVARRVADTCKAGDH